MLDTDDNGLETPNPGQLDSDSDGFGNACDADINPECPMQLPADDIECGRLRPARHQNQSRYQYQLPHNNPLPEVSEVNSQTLIEGLSYDSRSGIGIRITGQARKMFCGARNVEEESGGHFCDRPATGSPRDLT